LGRVNETGAPDLGHGWPFIRTQNWRDAVNGTRVSSSSLSAPARRGEGRGEVRFKDIVNNP
jgi:hypothetical protein